MSSEEQAYVVFVSEGRWLEPELSTVCRSPEGAKGWCNDARRAEGADPIQWKYQGQMIPPAWTGTASRRGTDSMMFRIEIHPLGD